MSRITADLRVCVDLMQLCDVLSKENSVKNHEYIKCEEKLRLQFIETNNDYVYLKTWLNTAYKDILTLKSEYGDLTRLYEMLLRNNVLKDFLAYANDQELLQLKFVDKMKEYKDLKISLSAVNADVNSLKSEYSNLSRQTEILSKKTPEKDTSDFFQRQETLKLKFIETIEENERLKSSLDTVNEAIIVLGSEHDELKKRYQLLTGNSIVKEFLEYAKYQEQLRFQSIENSKECESSNSCDKTERLLREKIEAERNCLDHLSEELCRLLLKYQRRLNIPDNTTITEATQKKSTMNTGKAIQRDNPKDNLQPRKSFKLHTGHKDSEKTKIKRPYERIVHGGDTRYSCAHCQKIFLHKVNLAAHIRATHSSELSKSFQCTKCEKSFVSESKLNEHQSVHLLEKVSKSEQSSKQVKNGTHHEPIDDEVVSRYSCAHCNKRYDEKKSLSDHIHKQHFSRSGKQFKCTMCEKAFAKNYRLQSHINGVHSSQTPYKCSKCDRCFKSQGSRKRHEEDIHNPTFPFSCKHCNARFNQKCHLTQHEQRKHSTSKVVDKPFECKICGKRFELKYRLLNHEISHSKEKPYKCSMCDSSFKYKGDRIHHERVIHSDKPLFICAHCNRGYRYKEELSRHILKKHLSKPVKPTVQLFRCPTCGEVFHAKKNLRNHLYVHSSKRPFKCSLCDASFKRRYEQVQHTRVVHSNKTFFKCTHCDKEYRYKRSLTAHFRSYHPELSDS